MAEKDWNAVIKRHQAAIKAAKQQRDIERMKVDARVGKVAIKLWPQLKDMSNEELEQAFIALAQSQQQQSQ